MLLDKQVTFSDQQSLALTAGTPVLSDNTIDMRPAAANAAGRNTVVPGIAAGVNLTPVTDFARGQRVPLLAQITEAVTSGGAATLTVELVTHATDAALTGATARASTGALPLAQLTLGAQLALTVPPGITDRYWGLRYTVGTANTTAGRITAGFVLDRQQTY